MNKPLTLSEQERFVLDDQNVLFEAQWERLTSGRLYKIMTKDTPDQEGAVVPFIPNAQQKHLYLNIWHRTALPKARQIGYTTAICILWLDHALFIPDQRCGIIAHDDVSVKAIFRDKVKFAYENMPPMYREQCPLKRDADNELLFAHNNSSIRVGLSLRSGTFQRLHVSELAKMSKFYPIRAKEVVKGSFPTVPTSGILVVESTSEGPGGDFHDICMAAKKIQDLGQPVTARQWRLHFVPWWQSEDYELSEEDAKRIAISTKEHEYFDEIESKECVEISLGQRAWYIAVRDNDFGSDPQSMWREYPSTFEECWQASKEGTYYAVQLTAARMQNRICALPWAPHVQVNTFWDIGARDGTGIWFHQWMTPQHRFLKYIEGWGEPYVHFIRQMDEIANEHGIFWGTHYLPHDADHERQLGTRVCKPIDMLRELKPGWRFEIVPRVDELQHGIQAVRQAFSSYWFDAEGTKEGIRHVELYRKTFNRTTQTYSDEPFKDEHTEAADALRQHAQGWSDPLVGAGQAPQRKGIRRTTT